MTPFSPEEITAWVQERLKDRADNEYHLQPGEFTAEMYAEWTGCGASTAYRHLRLLREADAIPCKRVKTGTAWTWIYWRDE